MEKLKNINRRLSKLSEFIERINKSSLRELDLDGFGRFIKKLERLYGDMDLDVNQHLIPFTQDGELADTPGTEQFNKYVIETYESKIKVVSDKLKGMQNACKNFSKEYRNALELNADLSNSGFNILNDFSGYLSTLSEWANSELELISLAEDIGLAESEGEYSHLLEQSNIRQLEVLKEFKLLSRKEIELFAEHGQKSLDKLFNRAQERTEIINANTSKQEIELRELNDKVETLEKKYNEQVARADSIYQNGLKDVTRKKSEIEGFLGEASNRIMAQDYDTSALSEKEAANWLRYGSLACMAVIIIIVCYSFYDSTHSGFDWESSIFRTVLVFILSIPAAYLSRESTKHREQQYNYHHTALDLKAITPYIASLPEADQNRIKISIAERIFASRQTNVAQQDSFPLNTQELVMELIKKVDFKKEDKKDTQVESAGK